MFYINLVLNGLFTGDHEMVGTYWAKLQKLVLTDYNNNSSKSTYMSI